jgi:ribosomal protein S20
MSASAVKELIRSAKSSIERGDKQNAIVGLNTALYMIEQLEGQLQEKKAVLRG